MYEVNWSAEVSGSIYAQRTGKHGISFRLMKEAREYYHKIIKEYEYNPTLKISLVKVTRTIICSKGYHQ